MFGGVWSLFVVVFKDVWQLFMCGVRICVVSVFMFFILLVLFTGVWRGVFCVNGFKRINF